MEELTAAGRFTCPAEAPNDYVEHLRVPAMSVGTYSIPAGGVDDQQPHDEDEVYVVRSGRARFTSGSETIDARPGTTLFVPAHEAHHFHEVSEDLSVLVVFAPAYTGS